MHEEIKLVGYNVDTLYTNMRRKNRDGKLSREGIDEGLAHDLDDLQAISKEQDAEDDKSGKYALAYIWYNVH